LFARQQTLLHDRAVKEFEESLEVLHLSRPGIPNFDELNEKLNERTGWTVVAVPGLVPDDVFFEHLRNRRFPAGNFIRRKNQLDYLEEPDVFHDVFGHVPLLAQPAVADFMQELGFLGEQAMEVGQLHRLSSFGESHYSHQSAKPHRLAFDLKRVLRTRYRTDAFQQTYFVIDRFEDALKLVRENDFKTLCAELDGLPDIDPSTVEPDERLAA
jgi:phenylalanine-4-hydroxylase